MESRDITPLRVPNLRYFFNHKAFLKNPFSKITTAHRCLSLWAQQTSPKVCTNHRVTMAQTLHIITINCWGLKYLSAHRRERLSYIGTVLAHSTPSPDIVGLQECWTQEDFNAIRSRTRHVLPYGKFYWSGVFGGGLAILSRWPIVESTMHKYTLNGRPTAFFRGDWYVGKGVACATIRMDEGELVEVFCTHVRLDLYSGCRGFALIFIIFSASCSLRT
jgi:hypothetical protein